MKEIQIDGNNFSDLIGFYNEIERLFTKELNWETGRNLDALNDLLKGGFGIYEYKQPIVVRWINSTKSQSDFGNKATYEYLKSVLEKCHPSSRKMVKNKIKLAKNEKGETLFQTITGIIESHNHIQFMRE